MSKKETYVARFCLQQWPKNEFPFTLIHYRLSWHVLTGSFCSCQTKSTSHIHLLWRRPRLLLNLTGGRPFCGYFHLSPKSISCHFSHSSHPHLYLASTHRDNVLPQHLSPPPHHPKINTAGMKTTTQCANNQPSGQWRKGRLKKWTNHNTALSTLDCNLSQWGRGAGGGPMSN